MHAGTQHDQPFLAPPISSDTHVAGFLASISDGCTKTKSPVDRAIDGIPNCRFQKLEYLFVIALRLFRRAFHEIRKHGDEFM
jgi:hypothetical protein